jgi:alpha-galactosidase
MKNRLLLLTLFLPVLVPAQEFFRIAGHDVVLENGCIVRKLKLSGDSLVGYLLTDLSGKFNFINPGKEFSLLVNGKPVNGYTGWNWISARPIADGHQGKGIALLLQEKNSPEALQVELSYMLYPGLPVIRKWIQFTNKGNTSVKLEALNTEDLNTTLSPVNTQVYNQYGRMKCLGTFTGTWDDPVVVIHDVTRRLGMAVGNEAPGVLKRIAYNTLSENIEAGLTHPGQDFPFCKWLNPGETWKCPETFITLYTGRDNGFDAINGEVNIFVTRHMQPRIAQLREKPVFVYNTWYPFRTFVSDTLIRDVAKAAAECGIQEFIIDDGWQINVGGKTSELAWGGNYGDWIVDENKFPGGLKPTFDYIRSLGMKPGLWISIGSATRDAKVYKDHPEWFVKNRNNQPGNLHFVAEESDFYTSCLATDWTDYIRDVIVDLANDYGLAYAKLDLSVVSSAYVTDHSISGCYATNHPYHRDHQESFIMIYERLLKLFDELHQEAPGLFIDCTFETAGKLQLMDYALAKHAEGNWLSNFEEPSPVGPLRVRQMAWWRSPALPAGSLVIGNQQMDDADFDFSLKSLIGTLPIVLGDPRKIAPEKRAQIRSWSLWMQQMQEKYNYMSFRKDLPGFGEPAEGSWDGWMRINFNDNSGGIFGIFRQGALEGTRQVFLQDLAHDRTYTIRLAPEGVEVLKASGKALMQQGFPVKMEKIYEGRIFEVSGE